MNNISPPPNHHIIDHTNENDKSRRSITIHINDTTNQDILSNLNKNPVSDKSNFSNIENELNLNNAILNFQDIQNSTVPIEIEIKNGKVRSSSIEMKQRKGMYICMCEYVRVCVSVFVYVYYICIFIYMCLYIYMYIHIYVYIHIYICI
jgi:hypothetical protein